MGKNTRSKEDTKVNPYKGKLDFLNDFHKNITSRQILSDRVRNRLLYKYNGK